MSLSTRAKTVETSRCGTNSPTKREREAKAKGRVPDPDTLNIAKRLREHIDKRNISASKLSLLAQLPPATVYSYVDPTRYGLKSTSLSNLRAIASALKLSLHDLIDP